MTGGTGVAVHWPCAGCKAAGRGRVTAGTGLLCMGRVLGARPGQGAQGLWLLGTRPLADGCEAPGCWDRGPRLLGASPRLLGARPLTDGREAPAAGLEASAAWHKALAAGREPWVVGPKALGEGSEPWLWGARPELRGAT